MNKLRKLFMLDPSVIYLNHGSFGATPVEVFKIYQRWQKELEYQPVEFLGRRYRDLMSESRAALGTYLGTSQNNLVYTTNVTESLNIAARSLRLKPGDEVLGTNHEYGAIERTWRYLSKENGFSYVTQNIPIPYTSDQEFVEAFWQGVNSHTKVIFLSHITSPTALLLPVEEIIEKARKYGIISIIDGAHVPGQIPVNLDNINADFYGGNLHKWLCAPKGAGFLYASPNSQKLIKPFIVSWGYEAEIPGTNRFIDLHEWTGTRDISAYLSVPAAIEFQEKYKWQDVRKKCQELASQVRENIINLFGESPILRGGTNLQMSAIPLPAYINIETLKTELYNRYRIEVPVYRWNDLNIIRVSIQGYNTESDIEALLDALKHLVVA
jgi:isopenicillin-N epimerase